MGILMEETVIGKRPCGFCQSKNCEHCCSTGGGYILRAALGKTWICPCANAGHKE